MMAPQESVLQPVGLFPSANRYELAWSCSPVSTPYNHALALCQSRLTRTGVIPRTCAGGANSVAVFLRLYPTIYELRFGLLANLHSPFAARRTACEIGFGYRIFRLQSPVNHKFRRWTTEDFVDQRANYGIIFHYENRLLSPGCLLYGFARSTFPRFIKPWQEDLESCVPVGLPKSPRPGLSGVRVSESQPKCARLVNTRSVPAAHADRLTRFVDGTVQVHYNGSDGRRPKRVGDEESFRFAVPRTTLNAMMRKLGISRKDL
jgi:hypothetical protein